MKKRPSLGLLFVDLMASTFAIIFLVLLITLLKTSQEVPVPTVKKPTKHQANNFRIQTVELEWSDGDKTSHPHIPKTDIKTDYSGYIEIHEEYISYYKQYTDVPTKIENEALEKEDLSLNNFLSTLDKSKRVHIELFSPKYIYKLYKIVENNGLNWSIDYAYHNIEAIKKEKKIAQNSISSTLPQPSPKEIEKIIDNLEANAQNAIKQSAVDDAVWEYLTQKVYRDRGYDLYYYKDKDKIFLTKEDIKKYLNPLLFPPLKRDPTYWWALLMLLGMSYYLYKEFKLNAKENYL